MSIEIIIEDDRWAVLGLEAVGQSVVSAARAHLGLGKLEVSCLATNDARSAELNAEFRGKPRPTNVLSWPSETLLPDAPGAVPPPPRDPEIGDIALAYETCFAEAQSAGLAFEAHVTHLMLHGLLHLLGYDHENDLDADLMENSEIAILLSLGIDNPYG